MKCVFLFSIIAIYLKIKWSYKKLYFMIRFDKKRFSAHSYFAHMNGAFALKPEISQCS